MTRKFHCLVRSYCAVAITTAAIALCCAGCDSHAAAADAGAAAPAASVPPPKVAPETGTVPVAESADPKSFSTSGPLVAEQQADISAERSGRIVSIDVRIGDRVKKGQILAQLDDGALRSACESQRARKASAQAQLREWQSEQRTAESDLRRAAALRDAKIISEENWEHAKYRVDETIAAAARFRA